MTTKSFIKPIASVVLLLLVGGAGPCDQRVGQAPTSSPCDGKCTSAQICVHYPSCAGGGTYPDACEDRKIGYAELCGNYTGSGGSYTVDGDMTLLTCVCPPDSTGGAGSGNGGSGGNGGTPDMATALCGTRSCTSNEVCVTYPSCEPGGSPSQGCEPTTLSFAQDCDNYGGHYTVDSTQSNVTCVCPPAPTPCGNQSCASNEVCVHYPSCEPGGSPSEGCEPTTISFAEDCDNYGGHYTVDSTQSNVTCVCQ